MLNICRSFGAENIVETSKRHLVLRFTPLVLVLVLLLAVVAPTASAAAAIGAACPTLFTEYQLSTNSSPYQMATGFNGDVWFSKLSSDLPSDGKLGRVKPDGTIVEYTQSSAGRGAQVNDIVKGPDGAMWYTSMGLRYGVNNTVGRITDDGTTTEYTLPQGLVPTSIVDGPDGALWLTATDSSTVFSKLVRITTSGTVTQFALPVQGARPQGLAVGPDGAFWLPMEGNTTTTPDGFTTGDVEGILRVTTTGDATFFPMSNKYRGFTGIAAGSDGALWFTEYAQGAQSIGRITTDGQVVELPVGEGEHPIDIKSDGTYLWVSGADGLVGRITPSTFAMEYFYVPNNMRSNLRDVAITDTSVWVADQGPGILNRMPLPVDPIMPSPRNLIGPSLVIKPSFSWDAASGAVSYILCRDGVQIDEIGAVTSYQETALLTQGEHDYALIAVDATGRQSGRSRNFIPTVDATPPTISAVNWSANPLLQGNNTTLTVDASDNFGPVKAFYAVNGGARQPMTYDQSTNMWAATFGANLGISTYSVDVITVDEAGLETVQTDVLAVYGAGGSVSGHSRILPDASDTLPISQDSSKKPADVVVGFTNIKAASGQATSGSFDVSYVVKNNKDEFSLSSTAIDALYVFDASHASIVGHADLITYVNGVRTATQNVTVRFDIVLGTNGAADQVTMKIYDAGVSPSEAPTWVLSGNSSGNIKIQP